MSRTKFLSKRAIAIAMAMLMLLAFVPTSAMAADYTVEDYNATLETYGLSFLTPISVYRGYYKTAEEINTAIQKVTAARDFIATHDDDFFATNGLGLNKFGNADYTTLKPSVTRLEAANDMYEFLHMLNTIVNTTYNVSKICFPDVGGKIAGNTSVPYMGTPTYTITPNAGYSIVNVVAVVTDDAHPDSVTTLELGPVTTYTFGPIFKTLHSITATFDTTWKLADYNTFMEDHGASINVPIAEYTLLHKSVADLEAIARDAKHAYEFILTQDAEFFTTNAMGTSKIGNAAKEIMPTVTRDEAVNMLKDFAARLKTIVAKNFDIVVTSNAGGEIIGKRYVSYMEQPAYEIVPDKNYIIKNVKVIKVDPSDDTKLIEESLGAVANYTFDTGIYMQGHKIEVEFEYNLRKIIATTNSFGRVSPMTSLVERGGSKTVEVLPNVGYKIGEVKINGAVVENATSYTFDNVQVDQTIEVTFVRIPSPGITDWFRAFWEKIIAFFAGLFS